MQKEKLLTKKEKEVLTKYKKRRVVDEGDDGVLEKWRSIGFVSSGFNWDIMKPTAELTDSGKAHLDR